MEGIHRNDGRPPVDDRFEQHPPPGIGAQTAETQEHLKYRDKTLSPPVTRVKHFFPTHGTTRMPPAVDAHHTTP